MVVASRIDAVLRQSVDAGRVPGVVALVARADAVVYEGAFGTRELGSARPMTLDTLFWIASMTKPITSVAALQLVEQGRLQLDEPIGAVVPALAEPRVFDGWDADGAPQFRAARRPITLRHLLTHTAGFVYPTWNGAMRRYAEYLARPDVDASRHPAPDAVLMFDPGDRWEYGTNTDWVGRAVEAASGQNLDAYFREQIFAPLGMDDTGFVPTSDQQARFARRHVRTGPASFEVTEVAPVRAPGTFNGGGGLFSVGVDYATFLRALLSGGSLGGARLLWPETAATLYENHVGDLAAGVLKTVMPERSNDADFFPDMVKTWSLGGLVNPVAAPTGRSAGSLAWAGIWNTYFWLDPTQGLAGVLLTQIQPFADPAVLELLGEFERAAYAAFLS